MRRYWLDNLRWVTVILVLIYHVFYFYNNKGVFGGIGGFVDDPIGQPQDVVMYILYPWFMMLLFIVAGISARYSLDKYSASEWLRIRTRKLLVPSTIGLLVFQWMVGYFNARWHLPEGIPALIKWPIYAVSGIGPLWFIQDLWLFSLLLPLVRKLDGHSRFHEFCGKLSAPVLILAGGVIVYIASQLLIMHPRENSFDGLLNLYKPLTYFVLFLMGYFVFSHEAVQEKVAKVYKPLLCCAASAGIALVWIGWGSDLTSPQYLSGWLNCLYAWLMILALLGLFKARFDHTDRFRSYMSRSSYGIYIVHYLIITAVGTFLKANCTPWMCYVGLLTAVLLLSPAIYEILRRIPVVMWCVFGIRQRQ